MGDARVSGSTVSIVMTVIRAWNTACCCEVRRLIVVVVLVVLVILVVVGRFHE